MRIESGTIILILVGLTVLATGLYIAIKVGQELVRARASKNWPTTRGTITASGVTRDSDSPDARDMPIDPPQSAIAYEYVPGFNQVSSSAISYTNHLAKPESTGRLATFWCLVYGVIDAWDRKEPLEVAHRYPKGREVPVYYNPECPEFSVLEPGARWSFYVPFGIGAGITLLGLALVLTVLLGTFGMKIRVPDLSGGLFSVVVLVLGILLLMSANRTKHIPLESLNWPTVRGEVFGSYVDRGWKTLMKPVIFYTYEISGKEYTSTSLSFSGRDMRLEGAQKRWTITRREPRCSYTTTRILPTEPCCFPAQWRGGTGTACSSP